MNADNEQASSVHEQNLPNADSEPRPLQMSQQQQQPSSQPKTYANFNLKSLFNELFRSSHGLQMQKQRSLFRVIECISGKEIVDWLIKHQRAAVQSEAKLLAQCFVNETYLEPVVLPQTSFVEFKADQTLYKFGKRGLERDVPPVESRNAAGVVQQRMAKSTGVLIGNDLNSVQFNSQVANAPVDDAPTASKRDTIDFEMPTDGNEQGSDSRCLRPGIAPSFRRRSRRRYTVDEAILAVRLHRFALRRIRRVALETDPHSISRRLGMVRHHLEHVPNAREDHSRVVRDQRCHAELRHSP